MCIRDRGYTNQLNFFVPYTLDKGYPAKLGWQFAKSDNFPTIQITNFNNSSLPNDSTVLTTQINAVYKASVITSKPAIRYHFKTGQRDWPKT